MRAAPRIGGGGWGGVVFGVVILVARTCIGGVNSEEAWPRKGRFGEGRCGGGGLRRAEGHECAAGALLAYHFRVIPAAARRAGTQGRRARRSFTPGSRIASSRLP